MVSFTATEMALTSSSATDTSTSSLAVTFWIPTAVGKTGTSIINPTRNPGHREPDRQSRRVHTQSNEIFTSSPVLIRPSAIFGEGGSILKSVILKAALPEI